MEAFAIFQKIFIEVYLISNHILVIICDIPKASLNE